MQARKLLRRLEACAKLRQDRVATMREIADVVREELDASWSGLYDVDWSARMVRLVACTNNRQPAFPTFPIGLGLTTEAIATLSIVNARHVASRDSYLPAFTTTRSEVIAPIIAGDRVIGTIDVESDRVNAFDCQHERLLCEAASMIRGLWID